MTVLRSLTHRGRFSGGQIARSSEQRATLVGSGVLASSFHNQSFPGNTVLQIQDFKDRMVALNRATGESPLDY